MQDGLQPSGNLKYFKKTTADHGKPVAVGR
jgi:hypothetical protein